MQLVLIYCALILAARMRETEREEQVKSVREVARGRQLVEEEDS